MIRIRPCRSVTTATYISLATLPITDNRTSPRSIRAGANQYRGPIETGGDRQAHAMLLLVAGVFGRVELDDHETNCNYNLLENPVNDQGKRSKRRTEAASTCHLTHRAGLSRSATARPVLSPDIS